MSRRKEVKLGKGAPKTRLGLTPYSDAGPEPELGSRGVAQREQGKRVEMGHLGRGFPLLGQKEGQQSSVVHPYEVKA